MHRYDADLSGELDPEEFVVAVRTECKLSVQAVSDMEVRELFNVIDADGSGGTSKPSLPSYS